MAIRLSRRKIATYIADMLVNGKSKSLAISQLAGFLIDSRRTKELELIVRDIEYELFERGIVIARVTTAYDLTEATRSAVDALLAGKKADKIQIEHTKDPTVLGGIKVDIPGRQLDATIIRKLTTLRINNKK